jgi:succinate dehydrogenase / fumarate reductase membrane anchor subunit
MADPTLPAGSAPAEGSPPPTGDAPGPRISPITRGRARPVGSRRETLVWYFMRVSGVALFVLALAHFSIQHFIWDPASETASFIADQRWNNIFWRGFDWLLLMLVLFHAFMGVRTVVLDYVHAPSWRRGTLWTLYAIALVLFVIGTQVVLTLPSPM